MQKHIIPWKEAAGVFFLSRLVLLIASYIGIGYFPMKTIQQTTLQPQECFHNLNYCLTAWRHWDVGMYAAIASHGYVVPGLTAFFPLWPLLEYLSAFLLGGPDPVSVFIAGLILANILFYLALVLLYTLVSADFEPTIARESLFFLAFGPYALFFFAPYTETLFLLLTLACFLFLRRGRTWDWWCAGLCGFLAMLTRSTAIALIIPYFLLLIHRFWPERAEWRSRWRTLLNASLPILLIPAGLASYMLYLGITTGNPLLFSQQEALLWQRTLAFPWAGFVLMFQAISIEHLFIYNLTDLTFTLIALLLCALSWKRLPLHYTLFMLTIILVALSHPLITDQPLSSMPRYLLTSFPPFVVLALWGKRYPFLNKVFMMLSVTFFVLNIVLFVTRNWVA